MAATGDGSGKGDKRTGGTRPPTIELTATEVPAAPKASAAGTDAAAAPASAGTAAPAARDAAVKQGDAAVKQSPAAASSTAAAAASTGRPATGSVPPAGAGRGDAARTAETPEPAKSASSASSTPAGAAAGPASSGGSAKAAGTGAPGPDTSGKSEASSKSEASGKPGSSRPESSTGPEPSAGSEPSAKPASGATGAAVPPPRRGVGAAGVLAAALVGGVVGLAGALAVTHYGVLPPPAATDGTATADLAARVDALSAAVSAAPASDPDAAAALREAVAELSSRVDALAAAALPPAAEQSLSDRLSAVEEKVAATIPGGGSADAADLAASVTALGDRLDGLAGDVQKLAAGPSAAAADPAAMTALGDRVAALDASLGDRIAAVDKGVGEQVAALDDRLDQRLDALEADLGALGDKLAGLDTARQEAAALVAALGDRVGTIEANDPAEAARAPAAVAFAAVRLGEALSEGRPYAAEVTALKSRLPDSPDVATLAATADAGVQTRAALAALLALEKPAILAAGAPPPAAAGEAGPLDQFLSGAQSLVRVRPTGPESGDPVATGVEAVSAALAAGDLAGAETAWTALPEAARAAGPRFAAALSQRIAAEAAFARLEAAVLARLDGGTE